jgi:hypothetical protein
MHPLRLLVLLSVGGFCYSFINPRKAVTSSGEGLTILVERLWTNDAGGDDPSKNNELDPFKSSNSRRPRQWWNLFRRRRSHINLNNEDRFAVAAQDEQEPQSRKFSWRGKALLGRRFQHWRKLPKRFVRVVLVVCALIAVSPIMPWDMAPVNESWNPGDDRPAISRPAPSAVVTNGMMGLKSAAARSAQIDESLALKNNAPPVAILERGSARSIEPAVARKNKVLVEQQLDGSMNEKVGDMETKQNAGLDRRHALLSFVTEAVEKVGPSVVRIDTETSLFGEDSGLSTSGLVQQGQGSGLIFTSDGLILTNAHVVEDVSKVTVTLMDGRVFEAEVCGTDEIVDIGTWKKRGDLARDSHSLLDSCPEDNTRR